MNHPSAVAPATERIPVMCEATTGGTKRATHSSARGGAKRSTPNLRAKSAITSGCRTKAKRPGTGVGAPEAQKDRRPRVRAEGPSPKIGGEGHDRAPAAPPQLLHVLGRERVGEDELAGEIVRHVVADEVEIAGQHLRPGVGLTVLRRDDLLLLPRG